MVLAAAGLLAMLLAGCSHSTHPKSQVKHRKPLITAITAIAPATGTTPGGTTVTILGIGFTGAESVDFGPTAATSFTVVSSTEITAVSPPQGAGNVNIVVTTARGSNARGTVNRFTYTIPPPVITAVSPNSGTAAGGTTVTITGAYFLGASKVTFGIVAATSYTVVSDTQITAVTPAQLGARAVSVTTPEGTSSKTPPVPFTFKVIPVVTSISPASGTTAGGTTVTITGTGFTRAGRVTFNGVPAMSFNVVSDTEITAVSPALSDGSRFVYVVTPGGKSSPTPNTDQFTSKAPVPAVNAIFPTSGTTAGGTTVTITGTGFTRARKVTFGGVAAIHFTVISDTQISAVAPPEKAGTRVVSVFTAGGRSPSTSTDVYTYG
jgi:hypothetical protein